MLPFDPKKPLYGFTTRFPHAKRRIHLFADEEELCLFIRPKNASSEWLGALLDDDYVQLQLSLKGRSPKFKKQVGLQIAEGHMFRVFHVADPRTSEQRIWRIFWRSGFAYAIPLGHPEHLKGAFFWPQKSPTRLNLWNTPTHILEHHFSQEWHDPFSDVRVALPWCDLPQIERNWLSIEWLSGGRQELETVLRSAYICESHWPEEKVLKIIWFFETNPTSTSWFPIEQGMTRWRIKLEHRISRIITRLGERNQGFASQPNGARLDWIESRDKNQPSGIANKETYVSFHIEPPTQHERMEASLFLRDWLRENAPDLLSEWFG